MIKITNFLDRLYYTIAFQQYCKNKHASALRWLEKIPENKYSDYRIDLLYGVVNYNVGVTEQSIDFFTSARRKIFSNKENGLNDDEKKYLDSFINWFLFHLVKLGTNHNGGMQKPYRWEQFEINNVRPKLKKFYPLQDNT